VRSAFFYNAKVKTWDVIVIGGGIIGLSVAIELRKRDAQVLVVERGEPGREASHAAAGMLVDCASETPPAMQSLATASARMYPEFVHEIEDESGIHVDLRDQGTLLFPAPEPHGQPAHDGRIVPVEELAKLEPALAGAKLPALFLKERSVDPRALTSAALKAARHRGIDISSGTAVTEVLSSDGRVSGVRTDKSTYSAPAVVNCAGAWAGQIPPHRFPTRPRKGQMLDVVGGPVVNHVIRTPEVYLIPRSNGRILIGATVEDVGFDKRTDPETIHRMQQAAIRLIPALAKARVHEAWAGLRPGTPDDMPILGSTKTPGYLVATGHFRDGILLAPVTARVMAQVIGGVRPEYDISAFSAARFDD
jgi:glycine oxidase